MNLKKRKKEKNEKERKEYVNVGMDACVCKICFVKNMTHDARTVKIFTERTTVKNFTRTYSKYNLHHTNFV